LVTIGEKRLMAFRSFTAPKNRGEFAPSFPGIKFGEQERRAVTGKMSGRKSSIGVFLAAFVQQAHGAESVAKDFPIGWISAEVSRQRSRVLWLLDQPVE